MKHNQPRHFCAKRTTAWCSLSPQPAVVEAPTCSVKATDHCLPRQGHWRQEEGARGPAQIQPSALHPGSGQRPRRKSWGRKSGGRKGWGGGKRNTPSIVLPSPMLSLITGCSPIKSCFLKEQRKALPSIFWAGSQSISSRCFTQGPSHVHEWGDQLPVGHAHKSLLSQGADVIPGAEDWV